MPRTPPAPKNIEFQHRYRLLRRVTWDEWCEFIAAVPWIWTKAVEGDLGDAPNPRFRGAPQTGFDLNVGNSGVGITGRGIWRPPGSARSVGLYGIGPQGIFHLLPDLPRWWTGITVTGGRPYDNAVRLALQLLSACAPGAVEIVSTLPHEHWAATAMLAADILDLPEGAVQPPMTLRRTEPSDLEIAAEPIGEGLWRAKWRAVEVFPMGPGAAMRGGRAGFDSEFAALEAARRFDTEHALTR